MHGDTDENLTLVFKALADPTRRLLLDRLHAENGQTLGALCRDLAITRQGVTQHLAVLEAVGAVFTVWRGRDKLHYLSPVPLQEIHEQWLEKFERPDLVALSSLRERLEAVSSLKKQLEEERPTVDRPKLVHVTYIATTADLVWNALTDPELTARYWGHRNVSGWAVGNAWEHRRLDNGRVDIVGTILEVDPPRRLTHTWALAADAGKAERRSRVSFDLEPVGGVVRLTLTHEDLPPDQVEGTSNGWAIVLASLKSELETGRPLTALL